MQPIVTYDKLTSCAGLLSLPSPPPLSHLNLPCDPPPPHPPPAQQDPFKSFVSVTQQGGTPNYMAPELFNGTRVSDIVTPLHTTISLLVFSRTT